MSKPQTMIAGPLMDEGVLAAVSVDPCKLATVGDCYEFVAEHATAGNATLQLTRIKLSDGAEVLQLWYEDTTLGEQHRDYLARLFGRVGTYYEMQDDEDADQQADAWLDEEVFQLIAHMSEATSVKH